MHLAGDGLSLASTEQYTEPDGRKVIWNPVKLLRNANKFTWILLAALLVVVLIVVGIVALVRKLVRKLRRKT